MYEIKIIKALSQVLGLYVFPIFVVVFCTNLQSPVGHVAVKDTNMAAGK